MSQEIRFVDGDAALRQFIKDNWESNAADFMHVEGDGYAIVALDKDKPVGMISVYRRLLPDPLGRVDEDLIDIIEVDEHYRKMGIGTKLVEMAIQRGKTRGVKQLRAWSEECRVEALHLWNKMEFGLCPITYPRPDREIKGFYAAKRL